MRPLPRIAVSADRRHLVSADGRPFFWLADTAWELFHRPSYAEAVTYLDARRDQGFTVIQAVALAEFDGLRTPNANGDLPLRDLDPARPNPAYFAHVDAVIRAAAARGLYVALLPTWGDKVTRLWGEGPVVFDTVNAHAYGRWLGERYRDDTNVLWALGGDRPAVTADADYRPVWRALHAGLAEGLGRRPFATYHPNGGSSTSAWLQDEDWLDMHMLQSGHGAGHDVPVWAWVERDYARVPARPVLDAEPNYEDHPVNPWPTWDPASGYFRDHDVRKQCWRSVFAGGCGVTYGHHAVWQFYAPPEAPINYADRSWREALGRPGAAQLRHLRALVESRPMLARVPDQRVIAGDAGAGGAHARACRGADRGYAMVYLPEARPLEVDLGAIAGATARAWWYDPRTGAATEIEAVPAGGVRRFDPPPGGPDWALVLDDAGRGFGAPGGGAAG
jgi:hypothetical protein